MTSKEFVCNFLLANSYAKRTMSHTENDFLLKPLPNKHFHSMSNLLASLNAIMYTSSNEPCSIHFKS